MRVGIWCRAPHSCLWDLAITSLLCELVPSNPSEWLYPLGDLLHWLRTECPGAKCSRKPNGEGIQRQELGLAGLCSPMFPLGSQACCRCIPSPSQGSLYCQEVISSQDQRVRNLGVG